MKKVDCFFSFIVVSKSAEDTSECLASLKRMGSSFPYEVLLALGNNPSYQRNLAAREAKGNVLVFLDNDSVVSPFLMDQYAFVFANYGRPACVGGPSCLLSGSNAFERAVNFVFTSDFGLGPVKGRYFPFGEIRPAGEKDLILCNLAVLKSVFFESGGFEVDLHPNEENLFLNKLAKNHSIYYNPLAIIYRHHRKSPWGLVLQMIRYGQGRIKHYKLHPGFYKNVFMIPLAFFLYITWLLFLLFSKGVVMPMLIPLATYFLLAMSCTLLELMNSKNFVVLLLGPALFFVCHYCYGMGEFLEILRLGPAEKGAENYRCQIIRLIGAPIA